MARRLLIIALGVSLAACTVVQTRLAALFHRGPVSRMAEPARQASRAPRPADGLWAILDPGCRKPALADTRAWPKCASPFWINRDAAVVIRSRAGPDGATPEASYRTDYRLAAGDPVIAQVGNARDGYLFLALTELAGDGRGRLISATGAAFGCQGGAGVGVGIKPTFTGCEGRSPGDIRKVAWATLQNPAALARVAWIAPGAP